MIYGELAAAVARGLARDHADWHDRGLELVAKGTDFVVFRARSAIGGLAVRVPRAPFISNPIDPWVRARDLLEQEATLARHARRYGVPTPTIHALCLDNDDSPGFLVSEYINTDDSELDPTALGALVRAIHDCPAPKMKTVLRASPTVSETIAERLHRRVEVLNTRFSAGLELPAESEMAAMLTTIDDPRRLLHLDARGANVLGRSGEVRAVIDWSNALIGHPGLEIARVAEYGYAAPGHELDPGFVVGYGNNPLAQLPFRVALLYRLDTAVMLAVLFCCVLPDADRAEAQLSRSSALTHKLRQRG